MKCPKCQFGNLPDVKFCVHCGKKLNAICVKCGSSNSPAFNFCGGCGHYLRKIKEEDHPIDYSKPQSYTPKEPHISHRRHALD
jgi:hypothetical protein